MQSLTKFSQKRMLQHLCMPGQFQQCSRVGIVTTTFFIQEIHFLHLQNSLSMLAFNCCFVEILSLLSVHRGWLWMARDRRRRESTSYPLHPTPILCFWNPGTLREVLLSNESQTLCPVHQSWAGTQRSHQ